MTIADDTTARQSAALRARWTLWLALVSVGPGACIDDVAFPCLEDEQCRDAGAGAVCTSKAPLVPLSDGNPGLCSVIDSSCSSGRGFVGIGRDTDDRCVGCGDAGAVCCEATVCEEDLACVGGLCECYSSVRRNCAVRADGTVWCWGCPTVGWNDDCGLLAARPTNEPFEVPELAGVVALSATSPCGIFADGAVRCMKKPGQFFDVDAQAISIEGFCARRADSSALCWNRFGTAWDLPLTDVVALAVPAADPGYDFSGHACAITGDGAMWCWGVNDHGQLGDGSTVDSAALVRVQGLEPVLFGAVLTHQTCAIAKSGSLWCWGLNGYGQLGDGRTTSRSLPVRVQGPSGVRSFAMSGLHTCAVDDDKALWCWGDNGGGYLADGTTVRRPTPAKVPGVVDAVAVFATYPTSCVLHESGRVSCWGTVNSGTPSLHVPSEVADLPAVTDLASCVLAGHGVYCLPPSRYGASSDTAPHFRAVPIPLSCPY